METVSLVDIQRARDIIGPQIFHTPCLHFPANTQHTELRERDIFLKCENLQLTGSFKIRGASYWAYSHLKEAREHGVVTVSAGNHAQGVAAISKHLGFRATIVMPESTPTVKVHNTQRWGANVVLIGNVYEDCLTYAKEVSDNTGALFFPAFEDPAIIAGQGTIGLELSELPYFNEIEAVVIPVGGGGLASGVATCLKALKPQIKIYGVTAASAPAFLDSFQGRKPCEKDVSFTIAEGVALKKTSSTMLQILSPLLEDVFALSEESIAFAISMLCESTKLVVEGAGALPLASILEGRIRERKVLLILSGGNIDITTMTHVLHRGLSTQSRLVRLCVTVPDRPGSLNQMTELLAKSKANILQVFHGRDSFKTKMGYTQIDIDIETRGEEHLNEILSTFSERHIDAVRSY